MVIFGPMLAFYFVWQNKMIISDQIFWSKIRFYQIVHFDRLLTGIIPSGQYLGQKWIERMIGHFRSKLTILWNSRFLISIVMATLNFGQKWPSRNDLLNSCRSFLNKTDHFRSKLVILDEKRHVGNSRVFPDADNMFSRIINVFIISYI